MQIRNTSGEVLQEVPGDTLVNANLSGLDLSGADLSGADLRGAALRETRLRDAKLSRANLSRANLTMAGLHWANLSEADLTEANLSWANLRRADLSMVDLTKVNLSEADMAGAHIEGTILPPPLTPSEGDFTGYKKVLQADGTYTVITLRIPTFAQRTSALVSRKCRASHVIVVEGTGVSPTKASRKLTYTPGVIVTADHFDPDRREECTHGIHFFLTREEAEAYQP